MTNAPPDDPRLAEIRAALARVAERDRTTRPGVIEDYVSYGRSTLDDLQYVVDQLDAARATIAERDARVAESERDIAGIRQAFTDLGGAVEPKLARHARDLCARLRSATGYCDQQATRIRRIESQLAAAREDSTLVDALADELARKPSVQISRYDWPNTRSFGVMIHQRDEFTAASDSVTPSVAAALRAALASLRDRTPETTHVEI